MRIYVCGPMTPTRFDQEEADHTYQHFHDAAEVLKAAGHQVFNPASNEIPRSVFDSQAGGFQTIYVEDPSYKPHTAEEWAGFDAEAYTRAYREVMSRDIRWILECDAIALLKGWRRSQGAMFEHSVGCILGLQISNVKEFAS
jgi:hypothetical protein